MILQGVEAISSVAELGLDLLLLLLGCGQLQWTLGFKFLQWWTTKNLVLSVRPGILEGFSRHFFSYPQLLSVTSALVTEEIALHVLVLSLALAFCCLLLCARLMLGWGFFFLNLSCSSLVCFLWAAFCPLEFSSPDHLVISAHCWTQERLFYSILRTVLGRDCAPEPHMPGFLITPISLLRPASHLWFSSVQFTHVQVDSIF